MNEKKNENEKYDEILELGVGNIDNKVKCV